MLFVTTTKETISAKTIEEAARIAMRQGSGTIVGPADADTQRRRSRVYALTAASDTVSSRILNESSGDDCERGSGEWMREMGFSEEAKRRVGR